MPAPPTSQLPSARPIAFLLDDPVSGIGPAAAVTLYIRPEDLTRQDPSRLNVVQSLNGGAWADSFGAGVPTITISGTTGWRRAGGADDDGEARFKKLRSQVWDEWHTRRRQAVNASKDPSEVQLIFSDGLDGFVATVAPGSFVLRRSKSRPLLLQYQIQMFVLADGVGNLTGPQQPGAATPRDDVLKSLGLESLGASLDRIDEFAKSAQSNIDRTILGPVKGFLSTSQAVYARVQQTVNSVTGVSSSLIAVAQTSAQAGANLFRSLAVVGGIPQLVQGQLMQVAAAYSNVFCVLRNALDTPDQFLDYSALYGASNCSSTAGGSPISQFLGQNTFKAVAAAPVAASSVAVSTAAAVSLAAAAQADVVRAPMSTAAVGTHAATIAAGVTLQ